MRMALSGAVVYYRRRQRQESKNNNKTFGACYVWTGQLKDPGQ